ncbi:maleylpyruvate isomerase N-terminal domain-containing protein [Actinoplanes sp. NPDC023801]|uniref:maleylpyruvate isomerase N-terminal domain-containing protein n=1 Tax=Actinoplanes sp. NPDC023801 TaxID=3154595 RepID=UPI0033C9C9B8
MISASDVRTAVSLAAGTLRAAAGQDWRVPAGDLTWSCRETVEHIADDLFAYAGQLAVEGTPSSSSVPFGWRRNRPEGPALTIYVEETTDNEGLLQVLESSGGLLAAVVAVAPPERRAFHPYGVSDPAGFAAMGVVETLVHMHDVAAGLGLPWSPPEDLCDRSLRRLFRDVAATTTCLGSRWTTLLWATGRLELPGRPRRENWKWDGTPAT